VKSLLRNILLNALCLFLLAQIISGLNISGGFWAYILSGFCLTILFFIVKPILNLISLPLNILTLGLFSVVTNGIIFYLLTVFIPNVKISGFTFQGFSYAGFIIPKFGIGTFLAFIVIACFQSLLFAFIKWLVRKY
jgi:putative membrane protein